ncbi:MAG: hypothetical protein V4560_14835 [Bacteroidota bacterium]
MKTLLIALTLITTGAKAQTWNTATLSNKVRDLYSKDSLQKTQITSLQAADKVMQTSINNLNASITKLLSIAARQDAKILADSLLIVKLEKRFTDTMSKFKETYFMPPYFNVRPGKADSVQFIPPVQ